VNYPVLKNIDAVCDELRKQDASHHYITVYNGFQTEKKNPNHMATRFFNCSDIEDACAKLTKFVENLEGGNLTIWAKPNDTLNDNSGKTFYLKVKNTPSVNGVAAAYNPVDIESRMEKRFEEKLKWEREKWERELEIKELKAQINGLQNVEPQNDTIGKLTEMGGEVVLSIVDKIPSESIGRVFEKMFGSVNFGNVSEDALLEVAKLGQLYFQTKAAADSVTADVPDDDEPKIF
jgi:hypothetical protein